MPHDHYCGHIIIRRDSLGELIDCHVDVSNNGFGTTGGVELLERIDEPRYLGEKHSIMTEIWPESFRNGKDELSMR